MATPVALLADTLTIAAKELFDGRAADVVKVATVPDPFIVTVPSTLLPPVVLFTIVKVTFAPGEAELIVVGSIARLKEAVINLPKLTTPEVLVATCRLLLMGLDEVTVGMVVPAAGHEAPGVIAPAGMPVPTPPPPPPPPHPAINAASSRANANDRGWVERAGLLI